MYTEYLNGKNNEEVVSTSPLKHTQSIVSSTHEILITPTSTFGGILYIILSFIAAVGFGWLALNIQQRHSSMYIIFVPFVIFFAYFCYKSFSGFMNNEPN